MHQWPDWRLLGLALVIVIVSHLAGEPTAAPLDIADRACLFLDDHFVAEQAGLKRTWHQAKPRDEVAIAAEGAWEKFPHLFGSVLRDPKDGLYKMYYGSCVFRGNHPRDFLC